MKKLIPKLRLGTDKTTTAVNRIAIRQSDRGEKIHALITTDTNEPYNLNNKYLVFKENKITGTAVRDNNVSITDASNGEISYTLHDAVHGADGVAWFDIVDSSNDQLIDSTADFYIKARDGLKFTALDVSYMSDLDKIKEELSKRISEEVDKQTADKLQQWKSNVDSAMQTMQQSYASVVDDFKHVKNKVDGYNQAVQDFNNRIDTTITNAESILKNASDKAKSVNETLENLKQRTQKQEENFNKVVVDTNNKVDTAINKIPDEIDKNLNAKDARIQELQNSITKLKDDVTAFDGKTKKQFEDIENHIKEVSNGIAHLDLSKYATKDDLKSYQPDLSKLVVKTKILTGQNELKRVEFSPYKKNDGSFAVNIEYNDFTKQHLKNLLVKDLPKIQESIGNLQSTKADKSELSNYATKTDLTTKADKSELGNYATKDELNSHQPDLSNYATKSDLDNKVDRSDLNNYAYETQKELSNKANSSELDSYATKGDLDNKADKSELSNYATKDNLGSKADRSELSNYATKYSFNDHVNTENEWRNSFQEQLEELKKNP